MKLNRLERYTPWKLLIVFLLVSGVANGQYPKITPGSWPQIDSNTALKLRVPAGYVPFTITFAEADTIPIIYLWCDTVIKTMRTGPAQWSFGYEVKVRPVQPDNYWIVWPIKYEYLDRNKNPLPKSVLVWMVKKTN